jgi:hypothetical protein
VEWIQVPVNLHLLAAIADVGTAPAATRALRLRAIARSKRDNGQECEE